MTTLIRLAAGLMALMLMACGSSPEQPLSIRKSDYSGTGDLMAQCMQYASESYCERDVWGGDE